MASYGPPGGPPPPPPPMDAPPPIGGPVERPPRPAPVTLAAGLMLLQVLLSLIGVVIALSNRDILTDAAREQAASQNSDVDVDTITTFAIAFTVGFALIVSIAFVVLAMLLLRGNNVGRIITWVVCGLFLCCSGYGVIGSVTNLDNYPSWYATYLVSSSVISLLIYIGVIVLLLLPASNAYFKPKPAGQLY